MIKTVNYKTKGVCSRSINISIDTETEKITAVQFEGGCSGNTQGVAALAVGMTVDEVIERVNGIRCGFKASSCPDQLATALKEYKAERDAQ